MATVPSLEAEAKLLTAGYFRELNNLVAATKRAAQQMNQALSGAGATGGMNQANAAFAAQAKAAENSRKAIIANGEMIARQEKNRYTSQLAEVKRAGKEQTQIEEQTAREQKANRTAFINEAKALADTYYANQKAADKSFGKILTAQADEVNAERVRNNQEYYAQQKALAREYHNQQKTATTSFNREQKALADQYTSAITQSAKNAAIATTNLAQITKQSAPVFASAAQNLGGIGIGMQAITGPAAALQSQITKTASGVKNLNTLTTQTSGALNSMIGHIGSFLLRFSAFTIGAGVLIRGLFGVLSTMREVVTEGIRFNNFLEQGKISLAAILASTRDIGTAQGQVVTTAQAYPLFLGKAAALQREILIRNIETLGTAEDLQLVTQRVLAFSADQKATDEDRLQLSQNILNAAKLLGLNNEQIATEARQILTLERNQGQTILQSLGITAQQLRIFKQQGTLVEELNRRLQAYSVIAKDIALTWDGLTSSAQTFVSLFTAEAFRSTFEGLKQTLVGFFQELRRLSEAGDMPLLNLSDENLQAVGRTAANFVASFINGMASMTNAVITFVSDTRGALETLAFIFGLVADAIKGVLLPLDGLSKLVAASTAIYTTYRDTLATLYAVLLNSAEGFIRSARGADEWKRSVNDAFATLESRLRDIASLAATGAGVGALLGFLLGIPSIGPVAGAMAGAKIGAAVGTFVAGIDAALSKLKSVNAAEEMIPDIEALSSQIKKLAGEQPKNAKDLEVLTSALKNSQEAINVLQQQAKENLTGEELQQVTELLTMASDALGLLTGNLEKSKKGLDENADFASKLATAQERAAQSSRQLAEAIADITGNVQMFREARLDEIQKEYEKAVVAAKGNQQLIIAAAALAATERKRLEIEVTQKFIEQEKKRTDILLAGLQAQNALAKAQADARGTVLGARISTLQQELQFLQDKSGTLEEQIALTRQLGELEVERAEAALESIQIELRGITEQIDKGQELIRHYEFLKQSTANPVEIVQYETRLLELQNQVLALRTQLTKLGGEQVAAQAAVGQAAAQANKNLKDMTTTTIRFGDVFRNSLSQVFNALVQGTLDVKDAFRSLGIAIIGAFVDAFAEALAAKSGFDVILKNNVSGIGGMFKNVGSGIQQFIGGALKTVGVDVDLIKNGIRELSGAFGSAGSAAGGFKSIIHGIGPVVAGAIGAIAGSGLGSLLGIRGSSEAKLGGHIGGTVGGIAGSIIGNILLPGIGGPIGSFLGSLAGELFGSFIGGLFAHTPTKGTQIRKAVASWFEEIDVAFADEIKSKKYFFKETKNLADEMFGGDFLAASKQILTDKVGPDLAKQLQAVGIFVTKDLAGDLDKDLEQTATTFGNLLVANLGEKAIPAALADIIDKAGIGFADVVSAMNEAFQAGQIGIEFYKGALEGAISLFLTDLPAAIDASRLANESLTEEGILDLDRFQKKVEDNVAAYNLLKSAIEDALRVRFESEDATGEDVAAAFKETIITAIADAVVEGFIEGFIRAALAEGPIAEALGKVTDLINKYVKGEIDLDTFRVELTEAMKAVKPEIDRIAIALGIASDELIDILVDAGVLPGIFADAADSAQELVDKITELNDQIESLSKQRIDIRVNLLNDLERIGAIPRGSSARARVAALQPGIDYLNTGGPLTPIGTRSGFGALTDKQLSTAIEDLREYRTAVLDLHDATAADIQDNLDATIDAIHAEYDAKRDAIDAQIDALQDEKDMIREAYEDRIDALQREKDAVQDAFRTRIDALQTELDIAEDFQKVAENLQETINRLVVGDRSALTGVEQLNFLQRQASQLRSQLAGAAEGDRPALMEELADVLEQMLGLDIFQRPSPEYLMLFTAIVQEIEALRDQAKAAGADVQSIEEQILATEQQMESTLDSIDAQIETTRNQMDAALKAVDNQIEQLRKEAEALSQQEQAAVEAAQAVADAQLQALREETTRNLQNLADLEDQLLTEQIRRLESQRAILEAQLIELVGVEQATAMLADPQGALIVTLAHINITLASLDTTLAQIVPAQMGYSNPSLTGTTLFAGHKGEQVYIGPPGGNKSTVVFSPTFVTNFQGPANVSGGMQAGRGMSQVLINEWNSGPLGKLVRTYVDQKTGGH